VKSLDTLVEAVARLGIPAHLAIVGDGPERPRLERLVGDTGISATFAGALPDARRLLPAFDVFANTSITEGLSVTILEAMDAGVPIVATRVGGTPEILEHGRTAHLVVPRSPDAVASAFASLAGNASGRLALAANARTVLESRFSLVAMAAQYMAVYDEVRFGRPIRDVA
jgi:glycosyltransferase involved in cell wall biosynthesis